MNFNLKGKYYLCQVEVDHQKLHCYSTGHVDRKQWWVRHLECVGMGCEVSFDCNEQEHDPTVCDISTSLNHLSQVT